jgi:hypothetical protein
MVAEKLMVVPLIDVAQIEEVIFEGGEVDVRTLPFRYHFLLIGLYEVVHRALIIFVRH